MFKKLRWAIVGTMLALPVIAGLVGIKILQFKTMGDAFAQMVMPPQPVNSAEVIKQESFASISSVGTVEAVHSSIITTEAAGVVRDIKFTSGTLVKAGDILLQQDIVVEQAQLRSAEAAAELARISYTRSKDLVAKKTVSQAELDSANARMKEAEAQVEYLEAIIARKTLRAPFDGKLGIRNISAGQYLDQGAKVVSLYSLDPVYVEFSLPQQDLGILAEGLKITVTTDAYPGEQFEGTITAINPDVDPATRNIRIQATLNNADNRLRPGMYVTVELIESKAQALLFIPSTSVIHAAHGDSVFILEESATAAADGSKPLVITPKPIKLGVRKGDYVAVVEGLSEGEKIVSTGVFKLQPGTHVVIDNSLAPDFSFTPTPDNT